MQNRFVLMSAVLVAVYLLASSAFSSPEQAANGADSSLSSVAADVLKRIESQSSLGRLTMRDWHALESEDRLMLVSGLYSGATACDFASYGEDLSQDSRKKRLYLFLGWKMPPKLYATEVAILIKGPAKKTKSIMATFFRAEASFAFSAGQDARSKQLERAADELENYSSQTGKDSESAFGVCDKAQEWHRLCGSGTDVVYTKGFLEGVDLSVAGIQIDHEVSFVQFRVSQIKEEINTHIDEYELDTRFLVAFVEANKRLLDLASVKQ